MRKNILHITNSLDIGGLETLLLELLKKIDRNKYNPFVCTMTSNGVLIKEFIDFEVPVWVLEKKDRIDYAMPFKLSKLFKRNKIDLIHTHNVSPWLYGTIASIISRTPESYIRSTAMYRRTRRDCLLRRNIFQNIRMLL